MVKLLICYIIILIVFISYFFIKYNRNEKNYISTIEDQKKHIDRLEDYIDNEYEGELRIYDNSDLNINTILDKINKEGINGLSKEELDFLKEQEKNK